MLGIISCSGRCSVIGSDAAPALFCALMFGLKRIRLVTAVGCLTWIYLQTQLNTVQYVVIPANQLHAQHISPNKNQSVQFITLEEIKMIVSIAFIQFQLCHSALAFGSCYDKRDTAHGFCFKRGVYCVV